MSRLQSAEEAFLVKYKAAADDWLLSGGGQDDYDTGMNLNPIDSRMQSLAAQKEVCPSGRGHRGEEHSNLEPRTSNHPHNPWPLHMSTCACLCIRGFASTQQ